MPQNFTILAFFQFKFPAQNVIIYAIGIYWRIIIIVGDIRNKIDR